MIAMEMKMVFSYWKIFQTVVYHWTIDLPRTGELFDTGDI
jgi:hypothetical protein